MKSLQEEINNCQNNECYLSRDIYIAPVVITYPCRIHGNGAVILCRENEDIQIQATNVELIDLSIEPEERNKCNRPLVKAQPDTLFTNVVVHGMIDNGTGINDDSNLPAVFDLGEFRSKTENVYSLNLTVDENCAFKSTTESIKVAPSQLNKGSNTITLRTTEIRNDVVIYAKLLLIGTVTREIIIRGRSLDAAEIRSDSVLMGEEGGGTVLNESIQYNALPPDIKDNVLNVLKKGQRTAIDSSCTELKVQLAYDNTFKPLDIDGYVFLLDERGKANNDNNLVYWGNLVSDDGAVTVTNNGKDSFFSVCMNKVSEQIQKIAVCYSIYGDDKNETFRYVVNPYMRFFVDGIEKERYYLSDLQNEKTIVAVEIYRHKGIWKLNCVGSGYRDGLKRLCEDYGLEVAE